MPQWKPDRAAQIIIGNVIYEYPRNGEYPGSDLAKSDRSIRRRLRYRNFDYDPKQVEDLRRLKDWLQTEISHYRPSRYYVGSKSEFASKEDFDQARMIEDLQREFPEIPLADIEYFVPFAVFTYWER